MVSGLCNVDKWMKNVLDALLERVEMGEFSRNENLSEQNSDTDHLREINDGLTEIVSRILVHPPDLSDLTLGETCKEKVKIVAGQLKVGNVVKDLQSALHQLKELSFADSEVDKAKEGGGTPINLLDKCRDVDHVP